MGDADGTEDIATALFDAYQSGTPIPPLRREKRLTLPEAYAVQRAVIERRTSTEGPVVGYKAGFTSEAIQTELGVDEPAYGHLLADTIRSEGHVDLEPLIDPKVEAELAIRLEESLTPPVTTAEVLAATDAIVPVIELVDSRLKNWDITAAEAIADNALSARVITGTQIRDPSALDQDLALEGARVSKNGRQEATGIGADVLGHPANVVEWLVTALQEEERTLEAGDLLLTGSATPLVSIEPGDVVEAQFASFGTVSIQAT